MTRLIPYQGYVVPQEFFITCNKCYERNVYQVQDTELDENTNKRYLRCNNCNAKIYVNYEVYVFVDSNNRNYISYHNLSCIHSQF